MSQTGQPRPRNAQEIAADQAKPDLLCQELIRVQVEKDRERGLLDALKATEGKAREDAAYQREVVEQARKQAQQDAADREANDRYAAAQSRSERG